MGFLKSLSSFFMPLFYKLRLYFEEKRSAKMRSKAFSILCNSELNWVIDDIPELTMINESVKPFSFINVVSQELFSINLFENDEPAENVGFKECKMIPMFNLNHFTNLYNQSLSSGFWSLFLRPVALLDEKFSKITVFKDKDDIKKHMIIVIKFDNDYIKMFKFTNI